jgi:hypothetical protein
MKTYIVYVNGQEAGYVKAASHNAAEKKAQKKHPPSQERIQQYMRVNPTISENEVKKRLATNVSVTYTEL